MSTKVFVGNLAFRTTDQALTEAFSKHGEVKSGVIITRGRRSLGYGFVEFATAQQAADAVEKMKGADIAGREIKVELAKDISEQGAAYEQQQGGGQQDGDGPARRRRRAPENAGSSTSNTGNTRSNSSGNVSNSGNNSDSEKRGGGRGKPRNRRGPRKEGEGGLMSTSDTNSAPVEKAPRAPRPPREPREPREKIPSKTTLFVANLPFSITDAELLTVFAGTKAKAAHVALTRNGRSRGYGFVEFENEADQLEALKTHQGKSIDGTNGQRNLSLTISHSVPNPPAATTTAAPATN